MTFEAIDQRWDEAAVAGAVLRAQNVLLQQARERIAKRLGEVEHKRHRDRGLERGRKANQQTLQDRNKPEFDRLVDRAELFIKETGSDFSFLDDGRTAWPIIDPCREWRDRFGRGGGPRSRRSLTEDLRRVKAALLRRNPPSRIAG